MDRRSRLEATDGVRYTVHELADHLGVCTKTIVRHAGDGSPIHYGPLRVEVVRYPTLDGEADRVSVRHMWWYQVTGWWEDPRREARQYMRGLADERLLLEYEVYRDRLMHRARQGRATEEDAAWAEAAEDEMESRGLRRETVMMWLRDTPAPRR